MTTNSVRTALDKVVEQYRVALEIPDPSQIHAILGAIAGNMGTDDKPVWLIFVGPPSSGKSEPLRYLGHLPDIHFASEITQGGLLSCSPTKGKGKQPGGFLTSIGQFGIIVISDLSPTLTLGEDRLGQFLSLMREVYDGKVVRWGGQDGGMRRAWTGKVGFIAASTGDIDRHHSIVNTLGDRYLYFRMPDGDVRAKMRRARARIDNKKGIEGALTELFGLLRASEPVELTEENEETLQSLAQFVAVSRTAVIRDPRRRGIEITPPPEEPIRLYLSFRTLLKGMIRIGLTESEAMAITSKIGLDSLPPTRLAILKMVLTVSDITVKDIKAGPWTFSATAIHRALEELVEYRILTKIGRNGVPSHYSVSEKFAPNVASLPAGTFSDNCLISWKEDIEREVADANTGVPRLSEKVGSSYDGLFEDIDTKSD